ncbi:MAG: EamA/RhaT family transporter [Bacteroidetes bacterium QS_7_67_15]|nr:MAG: EamA/RhaT family transporter [Bacteroidetes bacterium QS_7_67_15]
MTFPSRSKALLYAAMGLGVVSFALSPILIRWAEQAGGDSGLAIAAWRTGLASLLLAPVALPRMKAEWKALSVRDALLTGAAGVLLGLHFVCWIESLYHTSVASSTVLVTTSPVMLAVLGLVAVAGAALIAYGDAAGGAVTGSLYGNALAFGAALVASFYLLIGRVVRQRAGWLAYVFPLYTASALTTVAASLWQGAPLFGYDWPFYGFCLAMAVGPQLIGHGAFNYALQSVPAALVSMLALLEPVGASLLAYALFGETPPLAAVGGMVTVLVATGAVVLLRRGSADGGRRAPQEACAALAVHSHRKGHDTRPVACAPGAEDGGLSERDGERATASEVAGAPE